MTHIMDQNEYRRSLPKIFRKDAYDKMEEIQALVHDTFKPVHFGCKFDKSETCNKNYENKLG